MNALLEAAASLRLIRLWLHELGVSSVGTSPVSELAADPPAVAAEAGPPQPEPLPFRSPLEYQRLVDRAGQPDDRGPG